MPADKDMNQPNEEELYDPKQIKTEEKVKQLKTVQTIRQRQFINHLHAVSAIHTSGFSNIMTCKSYAQLNTV